MSVTEITVGKFHHFHLARQLERGDLLREIWSGYPRWKLSDEKGISPAKIRTFPWLQAPYMFLVGRGLKRWPWLEREISHLSHTLIDRRLAARLDRPGVLVASSGAGSYCGPRMQELGGIFICDRGSSHIEFQDDIMSEETQRLGIPHRRIDPRKVRSELHEYAQADFIVVPSEYVRRTFVERGVPKEKLFKNPYGVDLRRFGPRGEPDRESFNVLFVGQVSARKGIPDLLEAFARLRHPHKSLTIVGGVDPALRPALARLPLDHVEFLGTVPNGKLPEIYSRAHVFALASIEEGLSLVMAEAMACGCPVVATGNTGAEDLFTDGTEGFIVPIRSPELICDRLQRLADDRALRQEMSAAALARVQHIGGWDAYGARWTAFLEPILRRLPQ
jgi:glycosyltransferase involved in cell wall biosynthesis